MNTAPVQANAVQGCMTYEQSMMMDSVWAALELDIEAEMAALEAEAKADAIAFAQEPEECWWDYHTNQDSAPVECFMHDGTLIPF